MSCPVSLSSPSVPLSSAAVPLSSPAVPVVGELFPLCKDALVDELTALMDTLGGVLWLPSQHQYTLTSDMTEATKGSSIGYLGSHRQNLPENYVKNSMMIGASAGVLPDLWAINTLTPNGVTVSIVGAGTDVDGTYLEISMSGTAGGTAFTLIIQPNGTTSSGHQAPAAVHQLWSSSFKFKGVSGTQRVIGRIIREGSGTTYGSYTNGGNITPTNGVAETVTQSRVNVDSGTEWVGAYFQITVSAGSGTWDNVFRVYAPQLERGKPTAFTPTYGTAVTRGTNFEPAWQDTTASKPILGVDADGKSILTFDGTDDFFRTGIQTPEAGYIAGVWNLTGAAGVAFGMFSSSSGAIAGARFIRSSLNVLGMFRHNGTISDTCATVETYLSGKAAVDAHFAAASASVRKNGSYEVSNTNAVTATSINYFRIGASGAGGDAQSLFFNGHMLAQVWIPGARPGATVEARIRYLLAQICEVTSVL